MVFLIFFYRAQNLSQFVVFLINHKQEQSAREIYVKMRYYNGARLIMGDVRRSTEQKQFQSLGYCVSS